MNDQEEDGGTGWPKGTTSPPYKQSRESRDGCYATAQLRRRQPIATNVMGRSGLCGRPRRHARGVCVPGFPSDRLRGPRRPHTAHAILTVCRTDPTLGAARRN